MHYTNIVSISVYMFLCVYIHIYVCMGSYVRVCVCVCQGERVTNKPLPARLACRRPPLQKLERPDEIPTKSIPARVQTHHIASPSIDPCPPKSSKFQTTDLSKLHSWEEDPQRQSLTKTILVLLLLW